MDPITAIVIGGGLLVAAKLSGRKPVTAQDNAPIASPEQSSPPTTQGNTPQGIAGAFAAAAGAFAVGATIGQQIDIALGGDGKGAGGTIATLGGGAVAAMATLTVLLGLGPVGWIAAGALLWVATVAYAIQAIVGDINRLAYGQVGAVRDYRIHWDELYRSMFNSTRANLEYSTWTDYQIERLVTAVVDGYLQKLNDVAYTQWMMKGRGILGLGTLTEGEHAKWGWERGYFIANNVTGLGAMLPNDSIIRSAVPAHVTRVVPADEIRYRTVTTRLSTRATGYEDDAVELVSTSQIPYDPKASGWMNSGAMLGNVSQYVSFMSNPENAKYAEGDRVARGVREGYYTGEANADGSLGFAGVRLYWQEIKAL